MVFSSTEDTRFEPVPEAGENNHQHEQRNEQIRLLCQESYHIDSPHGSQKKLIIITSTLISQEYLGRITSRYNHAD